MNSKELFIGAVDALAALEQIYADYAEPDADFDALAKKQGELEAIIEAQALEMIEQLRYTIDTITPDWR